jgi:hypothetical protein
MAVGDPGLFSFVKKFARKALKVASILPGPIGSVAGIASGMLGAGAGRPQLAPPGRRMPTITVRGAGAMVPGGVALAGQARLAPSAAPGADGCPKGTRLNKSDYFLKSGQFVPKGTRCVSYRRTNPANARALRKALSREEAFIKLARRSGLVALPKARRVRRAAGRGK